MRHGVVTTESLRAYPPGEPTFPALGQLSITPAAPVMSPPDIRLPQEANEMELVTITTTVAAETAASVVDITAGEVGGDQEILIGWRNSSTSAQPTGGDF